MKKEGKKSAGQRNHKRLRKQSFRRIFIRYFLGIGICLSVFFCIGACLGMELYAKQYQLAQNKILQKFNNTISEIVGTSEDTLYQEEWIAELTANMIKEQSLVQITSFLYRMDIGKEIAATTNRPYMVELPDGEKNKKFYYIANESYSELIEDIEQMKKECLHDKHINADMKVEGIYVNEGSFYFGNVLSTISKKGEILSTHEHDYTPEFKYLNNYSYISTNDVHLEGPYYADAQITKKNQNYLEQHYDVSDKILSGQLDGYDSIVDSHLFQDSFVITCSPLHDSQNLGPKFCMVNVYHYNLWQKCGLAVKGGAVMTFLIILLSSFFFSYRHYMLQKIQWEMLSYRKNIINIMAHDLRTPLTAISGYAENIINESHPEKNEIYLQNIVDNVQYMNELIQHVLLLSGEVDSQQQPHIEPIELAEITEELIKYYAGQIEEKNIRIHQNGTCSLSVNATWFNAVLKNLIGNAIDHGKKGSIVTISMDSTSYTITNSMQLESNRNSRKGMGMAIVKEILEYYGYQMEVPEKDNMFMVSLSFTDQKSKDSNGKNMIIDEKNKTIYADYENLSKKELKIVNKYTKKGYTLMRKDPEKVFIAPHNMGIHPKSFL